MLTLQKVNPRFSLIPSLRVLGAQCLWLRQLLVRSLNCQQPELLAVARNVGGTPMLQGNEEIARLPAPPSPAPERWSANTFLHHADQLHSSPLRTTAPHQKPSTPPDPLCTALRLVLHEEAGVVASKSVGVANEEQGSDREEARKNLALRSLTLALRSHHNSAVSISEPLSETLTPTGPTGTTATPRHNPDPLTPRRTLDER